MQKISLKIPVYHGIESLKQINKDTKEFYEECSRNFRSHKINNLFLEDGTPI